MSRASLTFTSGDIALDLAPHERTEADVADRPICSPGEDVRNGSGRLERNRTLMSASTRRVKIPCHWGDLRGSLLPGHEGRAHDRGAWAVHPAFERGAEIVDSKLRPEPRAPEQRCDG